MQTTTKKYNPLDFDKDIAIGIKLPYSNTYSTFSPNMDYVTGSLIRNDSVSLFEKTYTSADQTTYNLINLVLTKKGERLMHPDFGTSVYGYLFEPIDTTVEINLKESLTRDIKYWLPYIIINDIIVTSEGIDENTLHIAIKFQTNEFEEERTLSLGFGKTIEYNIT